MYDFASVDGLGGGMELGIIQTDSFNLVHRTGILDLGAEVVRANRHLTGWTWDDNFGPAAPKNWKQVDVPFISSNPPCSQWSTLTRKDLRGSGAQTMQYTDEVFDYVAFLKRPPELFAIESVQQAFSTGRSYYQEKRDYLEERTGRKWELIWVMHSNASVGGASTRKRVFIVFSQIPFGVEYAQPMRIARFGDAVRDLEGLTLISRKQPYRRPATWWSAVRRASDGVDGHFNNPEINADYAELMDIAAEMNDPWIPGENLGMVLRRVWTKHGDSAIPKTWARHIDKMVAKDFELGINQTTMWKPDIMGRVVTGTGVFMSVHYKEHRLLTHRECFRLQGFPDTWNLWPVRDYKKLSSVVGKGVPVDAGRWLGTWAKAALDNDPGRIQGLPIGPHERKINITSAYKDTARFERPWDFTSNTIHEQSGLHVIQD